jgi:hypothetical protein
MRIHRHHVATFVAIAALIGTVFSTLQNSGPALGYPSGTQVPTLSAPQITHRL